MIITKFKHKFSRGLSSLLLHHTREWIKKGKGVRETWRRRRGRRRRSPWPCRAPWPACWAPLAARSRRGARKTKTTVPSPWCPTSVLWPGRRRLGDLFTYFYLRFRGRVERKLVKLATISNARGIFYGQYRVCLNQVLSKKTNFELDIWKNRCFVEGAWGMAGASTDAATKPGWQNWFLVVQMWGEIYGERRY